MTLLIIVKNENDLFLFADDAKLFKHVLEVKDAVALNDSCQRILDWSEKWKMSLNFDKCKSLTIAHGKAAIDFKYNFVSSASEVINIERLKNMKDLGVTVDLNLSFKEHIYEKINKAYQIIGIMSRNFRDLDKFSFIMIYKSLVRSHVEYAVSVWNPYKDYLINDIEKVQKRATKLVKGLRAKSYIERLKILQLPTLKFRRARGDMIEVFKILTKRYDDQVGPLLIRSSNVRTRGHPLKLETARAGYDLRKYSFTCRVVSLWNSLPENVVCAESVNSFKNRLDKHWSNQDLFYNYKAEFTGSI